MKMKMTISISEDLALGCLSVHNPILVLIVFTFFTKICNDTYEFD